MSPCLQSSYCTMRRQFSCCRSSRAILFQQSPCRYSGDEGAIHLCHRPYLARPTLLCRFATRSTSVSNPNPASAPSLHFLSSQSGLHGPASARVNCRKPKHRIPAFGHQGLKQDTAPLGAACLPLNRKFDRRARNFCSLAFAFKRGK